jgi:hypothetical protein
MDTFCGFVQVLIDFYQSIVNFSFTILELLGLSTPNIAGLFQPFFPFCTFQ